MGYNFGQYSFNCRTRVLLTVVFSREATKAWAFVVVLEMTWGDIGEGGSMCCYCSVYFLFFLFHIFSCSEVMQLFFFIQSTCATCVQGFSYFPQ